MLYVIVQLLALAQRGERRALVYWGMLTGLAAGFTTDTIVSAGGA